MMMKTMLLALAGIAVLLSITVIVRNVSNKSTGGKRDGTGND